MVSGGLSGMCHLECVHAFLALACWGLTKSYPIARTNAHMLHSTRA